MNGEYWRIITCHFVHTGWNYLFLNLVGFLLVSSLFFSLYSLLAWLTGAACCMIGISLNLLFFFPALDWYVGFSGLLHGLFVMGIIGEIRKGNLLYCFGLVAMVGKLAMEYFAGRLPLSISSSMPSPFQLLIFQAQSSEELQHVRLCIQKKSRLKEQGWNDMESDLFPAFAKIVKEERSLLRENLNFSG